MGNKVKNIAVIVCVFGMIFGMSLWAWIKKPTDMSDSERRKLAQLPKFTWAQLWNGKYMSEFETYSLDQFPARDTFREIKAHMTYDLFRQKDNNNIYISGEYVAKQEYPMKEQSLQNAADIFKDIYDTYLQGMNVKFVIVPDKNYYLGNKTGNLVMDYEYLVEFMKERTPFMEYVDIWDLLSLEHYYKTDTHWRQEMIYPVAKRIAEAFGRELKTEFTMKDTGIPFYGVYYGQSAVRPQPDQLCYMTYDGLNKCKVISYATGAPAKSSMYSKSKAEGKDAYDMFLGGPDPVVIVENPNATTDAELVIFRDSFGSSLSPLFAGDYKKITLVDIRYVAHKNVGQFVKFDKQDVLIMYSTTLLNSSEILR